MYHNKYSNIFSPSIITYILTNTHLRPFLLHPSLSITVLTTTTTKPMFQQTTSHPYNPCNHQQLTSHQLLTLTPLRQSCQRTRKGRMRCWRMERWWSGLWWGKTVVRTPAKLSVPVAAPSLRLSLLSEVASLSAILSKRFRELYYSQLVMYPSKKCLNVCCNYFITSFKHILLFS